MCICCSYYSHRFSWGNWVFSMLEFAVYVRIGIKRIYFEFQGKMGLFFWNFLSWIVQLLETIILATKPYILDFIIAFFIKSNWDYKSSQQQKNIHQQQISEALFKKKNKKLFINQLALQQTIQKLITLSSQIFIWSNNIIDILYSIIPKKLYRKCYFIKCKISVER